MSAPPSSPSNSEDQILELARAHLLAAIDESAQGLSSIRRQLSPVELVKHHPAAAVGVAVAVGFFVMRQPPVAKISQTSPWRPWWKKALRMGLNLLFRRLLMLGLQRMSLAQSLRVFKKII